MIDTSRNKKKEKERKRVSPAKRGLMTVGIAVCGILLAVAVASYLGQLMNYSYEAAAYSAVAKEVKREDDSGSEIIDFIKVKKAGSTAKDWINIPGTGVDYPLVQGEDNDFYLNHDAYGNESSAGAIFINCYNSPGLIDNKTVIFGHNQSGHEMFTDIHSYADEGWGREHSELVIDSSDGTKRKYSLLCYIYTQPLDDAVYTVEKEKTADLCASELLSEASVSYKDYAGGKLVCLSTCKYNTMRSVAVFELMSEEKPTVSTVYVDPTALAENNANNAASGENSGAPTDAADDVEIAGRVKKQ